MAPTLTSLMCPAPRISAIWCSALPTWVMAPRRAPQLVHYPTIGTGGSPTSNPIRLIITAFTPNPIMLLPIIPIPKPYRRRILTVPKWTPPRISPRVILPSIGNRWLEPTAIRSMFPRRRTSAIWCTAISLWAMAVPPVRTSRVAIIIIMAAVLGVPPSSPTPPTTTAFTPRQITLTLRPPRHKP